MSQDLPKAATQQFKADAPLLKGHRNLLPSSTEESGKRNGNFKTVSLEALSREKYHYIFKA